MSQVQNNNTMNIPVTGTPLYNYNGVIAPQGGQQTVSVTAPNNAMIYNYPQSSLYGDTKKIPASCVNLYICNPSAIGGSTSNATYGMPLPYSCNNGEAPKTGEEKPAAIANTPIINNVENTQKETEKKEKKNVVELTDDYIKTLESYLKSPDKTVRKDGITELINRFEEDDTRYEDPALTALLNIALLDPDASNRLMAICIIAGGSAHGDEKTIELLKECQKSNKMYGQEADLATKAMLKASEQRKTI